jgi:arginase
MMSGMSRNLVLIGAPTSAGSYAPGQEAAPRVLRELGLVEALRAAGRGVVDAGDGPLQVWRPDREHPRSMNLPAVVEAVQAVGQAVAQAIQADADVLVIGGNCTVALGVVSAFTAEPPAGLLYLDRHFDLNTPHSTNDGALDWMGMAHALGVTGAAPELASAFDRTPLLTPPQVAFVGIDASAATDFEREQAEQLGLRWCSSVDLTRAPAVVVADTLEYLPAGPLAVHVDLDVLDFTDAPLSENTDGRNSGPSLASLTQVLDIACHDPRFRALSIGELNPARAAGEPDALLRFIATLARALGAT